jgi:uncharacterized protein YbjT (DUF2867 family)
MNAGRVLVTGATGYVGGRLARFLEEQGRPVRCLARRPEALRGRVTGQTEIFRGDVLDPDSLRKALEGIDVAFYLVHSMGTRGDFEEEELRGARHFGEAAAAAGVRRIIYLGGLATPVEDLSPHLRSRLRVGDELRSHGVPVIEFRASIILGSGSLSFEMIRALAERLPVMITPRWVDIEAQPIAIGDVLSYLSDAIDVEIPGGDGSAVFEIGGREVTSYAGIMREYARQRGLKRLMFRVPVLTPRLSSLWLGLVTPLYARVGRKLIDSIRHTTVVTDRRALEFFNVRPRGLEEAIRVALYNEDREVAETRWNDAVSSTGRPKAWGGVRFGTRLVDSREVVIPHARWKVFQPIRRLGGETGWYSFDWLWRLRGLLDLLAGGAGMRRGRPHPDRIMVADTLDFWRVEAFEEGRLLRLAAEMKLPGRAWLEFRLEDHHRGTLLRQIAIFDPVGLFGICYWYALYPLHEIVFRGLLRDIGAHAAKVTTPADGAEVMPG